jgi:hypothetical protein
LRNTLQVIIYILLLMMVSGCGPLIGGNVPIPQPPTDPTDSYEPPTGYIVYYVAPEAVGAGDGSDPANAAYFRNMQVWSAAQKSLEQSPVIVNFLPGDYIFSKNLKNGQSRDRLTLQYLGHDEHVLIIQGMYQEGTIFMSDPKEQPNESLAIDLLFFEGKNAIIRNLHFTGSQYMNYPTKFYGSHVLIEDCTFIDLPRVVYGATGAHYQRTSHITWRNNIFKRIGYRSGSHMIYNAYDPTYIYIVENYFEDCAGEYVRFRDSTDYVVAYGNTFKSTGTYTNYNMPFLSVPLFNDDNPANPGANPNYEYFGTHFVVANNTFTYPDNNSGGTRLVFRFYQSGWNPPGVQYYLTAAEANTLKNGTLEQKRALMQSHLGLDAQQIYFYGNAYIGKNSKPLVEFQAVPNYGETSRGFTGAIDITSTLNTTPVVNTVEEALRFWQ